MSSRGCSGVQCHATDIDGGFAALQQIREERGGGLTLEEFKRAIREQFFALLLDREEALANNAVPPTPHVDRVSAAVAKHGLRVPTQLEPWTGPRVGCVNAFGFGGNNAHVIVQGPEVAPQLASTPPAPVVGPVAISRAGAVHGPIEGRP